METALDLAPIKERLAQHYSRGCGEPVGLPRVTWLYDTLALIAEVERLRGLASTKSFTT